MKPVLLVLLLALVGEGLAQQFKPLVNIPLPDSIVSAKPQWIDADNDGLLDIALLTESQKGNSFLQIIKGDTVNGPAFVSQYFETITAQAVALTDYNHDNRMDIVVSGMDGGTSRVVVYLNQGAFGFTARVLPIPAFTMLTVADLDNDARMEWIIAGHTTSMPYSNTAFIKIYKQDDEGTWTIAHDSLKVNASALEALDADHDGDTDLFVSGTIVPDSVVAVFLMNQGNLYFTTAMTTNCTGPATTADFNGDGATDVLMMGESKSYGGLQSILFESTGRQYTQKALPITLTNAAMFAADFNSDGLADINYRGVRGGQPWNIIQYGTNDFDTLNAISLVSQHPGDFDRDGDLDILQLVQQQALHVVLYANRPYAKNKAPGRPKNGIAVTVFDRVLVYWDKSADDHTAAASLTYDLFLNGMGNYQPGSFDLQHETRLAVDAGNNGAANFKLLDRVPLGALDFSVQAIDNALHAGPSCIGNCKPCVSVDKVMVDVCTAERVEMTGPQNALWFSFADGYLGTGSSQTRQFEKGDTVFYFNPSHSGCASVKAYVVNVNNATAKTELSDRYVCENSQVTFSVEDGWKHVTWTSERKGMLGYTPTITYKAEYADVVTATLKNDLGCTIVRKTSVKISKPVVEVEAEQYKIPKGGSVTLHAKGAQRYVWSPATDLNNPALADPVASPVATTQYVVTGYDSVGCTSTASSTVIVEDAGFIPNLFTPNDDGLNDALKIFGLTGATNFSFTIYNREGALMFKTTDVTEAVQRGWDGTRNGTRQPPGVYFWKVQGDVASGGKVLLNGKQSGSIVLVR